MRTRNERRQTTSFARMAGIATVVVYSLMAHAAYAGERQFLVILATSPKQFGGAPGNLINPELVNRQYFDRDPDNATTSFLEYWEEISYGDVSIAPSPNRDKVTDWISLPWRITQDGDFACFTDLKEKFKYE